MSNVGQIRVTVYPAGEKLANLPHGLIMRRGWNDGITNVSFAKEIEAQSKDAQITYERARINAATVKASGRKDLFRYWIEDYIPDWWPEVRNMGMPNIPDETTTFFLSQPSQH